MKKRWSEGRLVSRNCGLMHHWKDDVIRLFSCLALGGGVLPAYYAEGYSRLRALDARNIPSPIAARSTSGADGWRTSCVFPLLLIIIVKEVLRAKYFRSRLGSSTE